MILSTERVEQLRALVAALPRAGEIDYPLSMQDEADVLAVIDEALQARRVKPECQR